MVNKIFYTDGSCKGNPGPGGFGVVSISTVYRQTYSEYIESNSIDYKYSEQCACTTNNREELKAILHVFQLAAADKDNKYIIYSDSAYVVNMINSWIYNWAKNNWKNSKNKEVENIDLIKELYNYLNIDFFNCQVVKVPGHVNILGNELADALATNNTTKYLKLLKENNIFDNLKNLLYNTV